MNPQLGFAIAGLLFLIAMIAGVALLVAVALVVLRVAALGRRLRPPPRPTPRR
ncbi:MAG: hypothetical protein ACRDZO_11205 [Egibacteraceae bacterium]